MHRRTTTVICLCAVADCIDLGGDTGQCEEWAAAGECRTNPATWFPTVGGRAAPAKSTVSPSTSTPFTHTLEYIAASSKLDGRCLFVVNYHRCQLVWFAVRLTHSTVTRA